MSSSMHSPSCSFYLFPAVRLMYPVARAAAIVLLLEAIAISKGESSSKSSGGKTSIGYLI